jgi:2-amino-4-hydroxy-6-hydroxymethyldihydropteridine diphosphokinase
MSLSGGASRAALSLGSNVGARNELLARARAELAADPAIQLVAESAPRDTAPQGFTAQPDFLNQVLLVRTDLSPWELLRACLRVEEELGRVRGPLKWGPRNIDVDILGYGGLVLSERGLRIPHAALGLRPFFLEMMREIGAEDVLP